MDCVCASAARAAWPTISSRCTLRGSCSLGVRRFQVWSDWSSHAFVSSASERSSVSSRSSRSDRVLDRRVELDARVEVARHEVGRADVDAGRRRRARRRRSASARGSGRRRRRRGCSPRRPATPGHEAADAADVEVDRDAGLRRAVERADDRRSTSAFIFIAMRAGLPSSCAAIVSLDLGDHRVAQERRRDEHLAVAARPGEAGEEVEHVADVGAELLGRQVNRPKSV